MDKATATLIYVVTWRYDDRSGNGIVKAFKVRERAEDLAQIAKTLSDREIEVIEVELELG